MTATATATATEPGLVPSAGPTVGWAVSTVLADRRGVGRLLLMALGIGLCALVLLALASISPVIDRSAAHNDAANPALGTGAPTLFRFAPVGFSTDAGQVNGLRLSGSAAAPAPPGTTAFPAPGELLVSPALASVLASGEGTAVRAVLPGTVVGTIDPTSLAGQHDLFFYAGANLSGDQGEPASGWGQSSGAHPLDLRIWLVLVTGTTIVAVPLLLFVALAARLGGARRDRRTALLRLLGATRAQVLLLIAIEAMLAALLGLALAAGGYLWLRGLAGTVQVDGRGLQTGDIAPSRAGVIAVGAGVPALAVAVAVLGGVRAVRQQSGTAGQLAAPRASWRLALLCAALGLGYWAVAGYRNGLTYRLDIQATVLLCAVVATSLFAVAALTGLLANRLARAADGGSPAWLLARRRLAQDGSLTTRPAAALATVLAGTIALIGVLTSTLYADQANSSGPAGFYGTIQLADAQEWQQLDASLSGVDAVRDSSLSVGLAQSVTRDDVVTLEIGSCGRIRSYAPGTPCRDGDTFQFARPASVARPPAPPYRLELPGTGSTRTWEPPAGTMVIDAFVDVPDVTGGGPADFVLTPGAAQQQFPGTLDGPTAPYVSVRFLVDRGHLGDVQRATGWLGDRAADLFGLSSIDELQSSPVPWIAAALAGCGIVTLLVAALGQWVTTAQQVADRRRAFALARASGVPAGTLMRSFVLAALLPMVVGTALGVAAGVVLTRVLRYLRDDPPAALPWGWTALTAAAGLLTTVVIAVGSALRLRATTGPRALRTE